MKKNRQILSGVLATSIALSTFIGISPTALAVSSVETDFVTSNVDIDELLEREYIDNVPLGYNENFFTLYQPGWGFDVEDVQRTGYSEQLEMPVSVSVNGNDVTEIDNATFIPSYVTSETDYKSGSYIGQEVSYSYENLVLGAMKEPLEGGVKVSASNETTSNDNSLERAFDGEIGNPGKLNWNTFNRPAHEGDQWLEVEFPEATEIGQVSFYTFVDSNCRPPSQVKIYYGDETAETEITSFHEGSEYGNSGWNEIDFDNITAKKIKIVFTPEESGKSFAFQEVNVSKRTESEATDANVNLTGYKYITQDNKLVTMVTAVNNGAEQAEITVKATSDEINTPADDTLTGEVFGYQGIMKGTDGFAVEEDTLVNTVTLSEGEEHTFKIAMSLEENLDDVNSSLDKFFADTNPLETQKEEFNDWFLETIPYIDLPDANMEQIYYFRWYTYRNHIRMTPADYYVITEFLPNVGHAGLYNTISCPAGFQVTEGRWLKNTEYLNDYLAHWLPEEGVEGGETRNYSFWIADAYYNYYLTTGEEYVLSFADKFAEDYEIRKTDEGYRNGSSDGGYNEENNLYWIYNDRDGMENAVSPKRGFRPTVNSYNYGDALAISKIYGLIGDSENEAYYLKEAEDLKASMNAQLWDAEDSFYKSIEKVGDHEISSDGVTDVMEEIGYIPWMFNAAEDTPEFAEAWKYLMDEDYFFAPYGIRTAEKEYAVAPGPNDYGASISCKWNGPVWPFSTSQTLVGLSNLLNDYENHGDVITEDDYYTLLKQYADSQYKNDAPWIAENLDGENGKWISDDWMSPNYTHSTYADLIISGLMGIRSDNDNTIEINPLVPESAGWDYFCLENVPYHGKLITIKYDKDGTRYNAGSGFQVYVDGELKSQTDSVQAVSVPLGDSVAPETNKTELRSVYNSLRTVEKYEFANTDWTSFDSALEKADDIINNASSTQDEIDEVINEMKAESRLLVKKGALQLEAEHAIITSPASAKNGEVGGIDNENATVTFTFDVPTDGEYDFIISASGSTDFPNASHKYYLNGDKETGSTIKYTPTGWSNFEEYPFTLNLKAGENKLTFTYNSALESSFAKLNYLKLNTGDINKAELIALYDENVNKTNDNYSENSWLAFEKAMEDCEEILWKPNSSQTEINEALANLNVAISALEVTEPEEKIHSELYVEAKAEVEGSADSKFKLSLANTSNVYNISVTFETDGTDISVSAVDGYTVLNDNKGAVVDGMYEEEFTFLSEDAGSLINLLEKIKVANVNVTGEYATLKIKSVVVSGTEYGTFEIKRSEATYGNEHDVNNDGVVDGLDIAIIQQHYQASNIDTNWNEISHLDMNEDGKVDMSDIFEVYINRG